MPPNEAFWFEIAAAVIAALALVVGLWSFAKTSRLQHYTELDRLYFDIVALRVAHTHLGDKKLIARMADQEGSESALRYDSYALLIWNFVETIFDRCKQRDLFETWKPILYHEGALHFEWFARNLSKFKPDFCKWASREIPREKRLVDDDGLLLEPLEPPARAQRRAVPPAHYDVRSVDLSHRLIETIASWETGELTYLDETRRNWRIAEALHLATWHRPLTFAPLALLLEEERISVVDVEADRDAIEGDQQ